MSYKPSESEKEILQFWNEKEIFKKSLEQTKKGKPFVFYDGPPFATGTPHYGHLEQSVIKDAIPRYKTMQGFYVERQWGWDCHGLPIENIVEKNLGTKTKKDIIALGVKKFNDLCREQIFTFINEWERIIPRFGRWVDMKNSYRTMDFEYMQSEWWAFKELYKKGLIYEDYRSMHVCPRCETTLSQAEVAEGYKDIRDFSATVKFELIDHPGTYFLAWTTTPWTLPGNVALALGKDISYVTVNDDEGTYILGKDAFERYQDKFKNPQIISEEKGDHFAGLSYKPLFDVYAADPTTKKRENGWKAYVADFVTVEDGTGIVHVAPAFGADDMALGKKEDLPFVQHVTMDGTFKPEMEDMAGLDLKPRAKEKPEEIREADLTVLRKLEEKGVMFSYEKYEHSYPHCWRCDTALLNYATSSWFVAVEKIKPKFLKTAKKINWSPDHIKEGRFGQWLEGARDWSISRQRFWANTIPVWRCEQCRKESVFASAQELQKASGTLVGGLHKDIVDEVVFFCPCGGVTKRVPDVLDTWFDSGSMPFATQRKIPADFIAEAAEQTIKWFYYQHVLAAGLFGKEAFKNAVATGIILAEDGKKMSKKLKNYPDPSEVIEKYGADTLRFYILSSPLMQAENLWFSEKNVDELAKKNIGRLSNVLEFYKLYQDGTSAHNKSKNALDFWILARLDELTRVVTEGYELYRVDIATRPLTSFIDDLSAWYLRRSRERLKEEGEDKKLALATLRYVLHTLSLLMAPAMPFFAEYMFQAVKDETGEESVHLAAWPKGARQKKTDVNTILKMEAVRSVVNAALSERTAKALKVRQPLARLKVKREDLREEAGLLELIKDEVNVKEIVFDGTMDTDVLLDTVLTEELKQEGYLREIVRAVQDMRKQAGLTPQDTIVLAYEGFTVDTRALAKEVKATAISPFQSGKGYRLTKEMDLDGQKITLAIE